MPERNASSAAVPNRASDQLGRILYILPAAAREGGAALAALAAALDVSQDRVVQDVTTLTQRCYYHPCGSADDFQIQLTADRVSVWTKGDFQRPVKLSLPEAVCLGLALRGEGVEACEEDGAPARGEGVEACEEDGAPARGEGVEACEEDGAPARGEGVEACEENGAPARGEGVEACEEDGAPAQGGGEKDASAYAKGGKDGGRAKAGRALLEKLEGALAGVTAEELLQQIEASDLRPGDSGIRATLTEALTESVSCHIRYLKPEDAAPTDRVVRPYALVHAEGCWYLLAYCELSEEVRVFRIDRILEAVPTGAPFQVPDDFDSEEYIDGGRVYRGGDETTVRVRYSPRIARWISEREGLKPSDDGSLTVTHRVADPHWIIRHVLQYGPDAEVLEPEEARAWVREVVESTGLGV